MEVSNKVTEFDLKLASLIFRFQNPGFEYYYKLFPDGKFVIYGRRIKK